MNAGRRFIAAAAAPALALYAGLFAARGLPGLDFWWWMSANVIGLTALGAILDRSFLPRLAADAVSRPIRKIGLGLLSALVLYAVFLLGNTALRRLYPGAAGQIASVYDLRDGAGPVRIVLLLALVIGPGEELFWRALFQANAVTACGAPAGLLLAACVYAGVHIAAANPVLVLAALVCGLYWGALYHRFRSPLLNAVSHTAWDLAVFVVAPFGS